MWGAGAIAMVVGSAVGYEILLRLIQTAPTNDRADWMRYAADLVALNPQFEYQMYDDERALAFASNAAHVFQRCEPPHTHEDPLRERACFSQLNEHFSETGLPSVYRAVVQLVMRSDLFRLAAASSRSRLKNLKHAVLWSESRAESAVA